MSMHIYMSSPSIAYMCYVMCIFLSPPPPLSVSNTLQVSRGSSTFFDTMRSLAQREDMSVGTLLGRVLPFTEETSSNDQSEVRRDHLDALHLPEMEALHTSAVEIRRMIRVKMADENDFKQVMRLGLACLFVCHLFVLRPLLVGEC
jgi:hypothetical protein